jgi:drug/metabolite transporter (DMT)-like permease
MSRPDQRLKGILCLSAGSLIFTLQDLVIKLVSGRYPLPEALTIRCVVAFLPLLLLIHFDGGLGQLRVRWSLALILRGFLLLASYTSYYLAIAALPLATAVSIFFSSPLFIVLLAGPLLGEKVGAARWVATMAGFAGVLIVSHPDGGAIQPAAILSMGSAVFYALAQLMARRVGAEERASIMAFIQNVVYLSAALAMGLAVGRGGLAGSQDPSAEFLLRAWIMPALPDLALIATTGVVGAVASWLQAQAYRIAQAKDVAPFEYTAIPWAAICGLLIWGEMPGPASLLGVAVIIASGVYLLRRR